MPSGAIRYFVNTLADETAPVPWEDVRDSLRPSGISLEELSNMWPILVNNLGLHVAAARHACAKRRTPALAIGEQFGCTRPLPIGVPEGSGSYRNVSPWRRHRVGYGHRVGRTYREATNWIRVGSSRRLPGMTALYLPPAGFRPLLAVVSGGHRFLRGLDDRRPGERKDDVQLQLVSGAKIAGIVKAAESDTPLARGGNRCDE